MWKLFISATWRDPVLTDSLYIGNHDTSQWKTEIRLPPRTSSLAQSAILQTVASVLLKYLGKESIEGEMKALPPTALPPEPRSPVEQSSTLVFITPPGFLISHLCPHSPLPPENLSVSCLQESPTSQGPTTTPALPNIFSAAGRAVSLLWMLRGLCRLLSSHISLCVPTRFDE